MPLEAIAAEGLFFRYNGTEVLSDLTFGVEVGDYVGLVGPNGSGKTTLIKIILGLARPAAGSVSLFGREPSHFKEWHRVGYLPQRLAFFNPFFPATVREIVGLGLLSKKSFPKRITGSDEGAIERTLNLMDIMHLRDRLIGELSGGQQQRVLLARALVNEPDILILDEPTAALDPETRERFYAVLTELNKSRRATIILITHDIGSVGKYTSKLLYLDKSIIFYGGFEDFCHSEEMGRYFGEYSQHLICHRHE